MTNTTKAGIAFLIAALAVAAFFLVHSYTHMKTTTLMICGKESVFTHNNDRSGHEYRVYTSHGTFRVSDTVVGGVRMNSADTYGRLKEGQTYTVTYYGWRFGFTSSFPNIRKAQVSSTPLPASVCE